MKVRVLCLQSAEDGTRIQLMVSVNIAYYRSGYFGMEISTPSRSPSKYSMLKSSSINLTRVLLCVASLDTDAICLPEANNL